MKIDGVVFINLDYRTDRRREVETELQVFRDANVPVHRVPAIRVVPGPLGCLESHIAAYEHCVSQGWKTFAIFEDDFMWTPNFSSDKLEALLGEDGWDALSLSCSYWIRGYQTRPTDSELTVKLVSTSGAAGIVYRHPNCRVVLEEKRKSRGLFRDYVRRHGVNQQKEHGGWGEVRNDVTASRLMPRLEWRYPKEKLGRQRDGHSDLEMQFAKRF